MKKKGKKNLLFGGILIATFLLWTALIQMVDVHPLGQNGTNIGFALHVNKGKTVAQCLADLLALTDKLTIRFSELSDSIKVAEKRMVEIGALQTHINNYSKTRKTYEAYRKSGYSKKFFEEHRDELMLHKAAKQAFDQLEGKKVPSRQILHEEFNRLLVEKKQAYAEYRQVKKEMQEYLIAKQTVETILNIDKKKEQKKEEKKPLR